MAYALPHNRVTIAMEQNYNTVIWFRSACYAVYQNDATFPLAVFTGDTIFNFGCGRFFEGTASDMMKNFELFTKNCGNDTLILSGHDYTEKNLEFGHWVDPECSEISKFKIKLNADTVFTSWADELSGNVFLRCHSENLLKKFNAENPENLLQILRNLKNSF